jgi:hypothetical protein
MGHAGQEREERDPEGGEADCPAHVS